MLEPNLPYSTQLTCSLNPHNSNKCPNCKNGWIPVDKIWFVSIQTFLNATGSQSKFEYQFLSIIRPKQHYPLQIDQFLKSWVQDLPYSIQLAWSLNPYNSNKSPACKNGPVPSVFEFYPSKPTPMQKDPIPNWDTTSLNSTATRNSPRQIRQFFKSRRQSKHRQCCKTIKNPKPHSPAAFG